ncbi:primase-helicase family protein [Paraburkholderia atlantica]|uniref:primase-helicase family protein n=1 Tax=Paraburkholderia atlantica TaxID=2654982 RepID=UPI003D1C1938
MNTDSLEARVAAARSLLNGSARSADTPDTDAMEEEESGAERRALPESEILESLAVSGKRMTVRDFCFYLPTNKPIYIPTGELWSVESADRVLPARKEGKRIVRASEYLAKEVGITQMTWAPTEPQFMVDRIVLETGFADHAGGRVFNRYRPSAARMGDPADVDPWCSHILNVYPDDGWYIIHYLAHCVQHPGVKINHALVLGGDMGIGKDTLLEPVRYAVGSHNFGSISPEDLIGKYNPFVQNVVCLVSEARDQGVEMDRYRFFDATKKLFAAPPDSLMVNIKHVPQFMVPNCCNYIVTTNYRNDGLYLPPDDRRHYVAMSDRRSGTLGADYFNALYEWYDSKGFANVFAFLSEFDLSGFDPKATPFKTSAFWQMVRTATSGGDADIAEVLEMIGNPEAISLEIIRDRAQREGFDDLHAKLSDPTKGRSVPHLMERAGYLPADSGAKDGKFVINGRRRVIYALRSLSEGARADAAQRLADANGNLNDAIAAAR